MEVIEETTIPYNTGKSFIVRNGQIIRIYAESIVDCVSFNLDNIRERFDQARTKAHNGKIFISTGDKLYTFFSNPIMTIIEDTYKGKHDLQYGMCSKLAIDQFYKAIKAGDPVISRTWAWLGIKFKNREDLPEHGCWENMQNALKEYSIAPEDIPNPFNLFQSMDVVGPSGELVWRLKENRPEPGRPAHVDLLAEMNCLVAVSACPEMGLGRGVKVQIFGGKDHSWSE